jgi:hypothetical protein
MDYGEIITKSARITWRYKILWLFGLLAGCAGGGGNPSFNYSYNAADFNNTTNPANLPQPLLDFMRNLAITVQRTPVGFFILAAVLICGLSIVLWLVGVFGRGGLSRGAWLADEGAQQLNFGELAGESLRRLWRVAAMTLLVGLPGFAVALIVAAFGVFAVISASSSRAPGLVLMLVCFAVPLFCLLIPVFWFLGLWSELSTVAIMNEERGVFDGLRRAWALIKRNLGPVLLSGFLILIGQLVIGVLIALIIAPIMIGAVISGVTLNDGFQIAWGVLLPLMCLAGLISLALGSIVHTYIGTLWTLIYRRLAAKENLPAQPVVPQPEPVL